MTRHTLVPSLAVKEPLRTVPRRQGAVGPKPLHAMVAAKNENNLFTNRFFGPGMNVRRILYDFQHANK